MNYRRREWMTDDQYEAYKMLADLFGGDHHLEGVKPFGSGICMSTRCDLATFDFSTLTRAVFMAHDRCVRFSVMPSGPGLVQLCLHKRAGRKGNMSERHPTLDDAFEIYRQEPHAATEGSE